jgi:hypothetical protein
VRANSSVYPTIPCLLRSDGDPTKMTLPGGRVMPWKTYCIGDLLGAITEYEGHFCMVPREERYKKQAC